jgi:TRAP-type C4-dicarboxylate transport system substrate-binding protein
MFPEGEVAMTTKEPVGSCEDLNEVKFRVMTNPLLVESYKAFGATPTPLPWGEVYGALQTNIIQGQENPTFFLYSTKIYEVTDHITYAGHNNFTTAVMANKDFFDGLGAEEQQAIREAADAAYNYIVDYQKGLAESELQKIKDAKPEMTVTVLSEEERACFKEAAADVEAKFIEMTGDSGKEILEQLKADLEAAEG